MDLVKLCPLCGCHHTSLIYHTQNIPIFQNKVYPTEAEAKLAITSDVTLTNCHACGFVFNSAFNASSMKYDDHYQNEQAHSEVFQDYLSSIVELFIQHAFHDKKMVEIGCGKGFFLELLTQRGFDITGFDPAYTGDNPKVIKDYFSKKYSSLAADIIVLRHVLEHIENPFDFLHAIAQAVNYRSKIYIEVPSFEWIINNHAFWDIFYEHCNYFSMESLGSLFEHAEQGLLFNGQYMYLIADLKTLRQKDVAKKATKKNLDLYKLNETFNLYRKKLVSKPGMLVWGAGAKGVTFANLIDPEAQLISCLVDINPRKQNHYVAKTAHKIIAPNMINQYTGKDVLVMNDNYFAEIKRFVSDYKLNVLQLSDLAYS